jgi:hypothetical protein
MIKRIPWRDEVRDQLKQAFGIDGVGIECEIKQGISELYEVSGYGEGFIVVRLETEPDYKELVLVAAEGKNIFKEGLIFLKCLMKERNAISIRAHIDDPRIEAVFLRDGWHEREKVLAYGQ